MHFFVFYALFMHKKLFFIKLLHKNSSYYACKNKNAHLLASKCALLLFTLSKSCNYDWHSVEMSFSLILNKEKRPGTKMTNFVTFNPCFFQLIVHKSCIYNFRFLVSTMLLFCFPSCYLSLVCSYFLFSFLGENLSFFFPFF